jgi:hypothetical protein
MHYAKRIATVSGIAALAMLAMIVAGRHSHSVSANERVSIISQLSSSTFPPSNRAELIAVPAGTKIHVRLQDAISTEKNSAGDRFSASLDESITIEKLLAPARSQIYGQLTEVRKSDVSNPRASMTLVLRKMVIAGKDYELQTRSLTLVARNAAANDRLTLPEGRPSGRSSPGGIKANGLEAYMSATREEPLAYGPDSRFAFTLAHSLELPAYSGEAKGESITRTSR